MSRFTFRLERVLGVRRVAEAAAKSEWAAAVYAARSAEEAERSAGDELLAAEQDLRGRLASGPVDPRAVVAAQGLLDGLRRGLAAARERTARARAEAEARREAWAVARAERRALERLRERARARHAAQAAREEAAAADERALARAPAPDAPDAPDAMGAPDSSRAPHPADTSLEDPAPPLPAPPRARTHPTP